MPNDDDNLTFYNQELIKLSSSVEEAYHLESPDTYAKAVSPICGSEVTIELALDNLVILDFGYDLEACALTKTTVAIIKENIKGKTKNDLIIARDKLNLLLSGYNDVNLNDWEAFKIFIPVIEYKSRHNSILLPFEAIEKAFKKLEAKENK